MNIYTVRDNLKNTIRTKEALLESYKVPSPTSTKFVRDTMSHFLEVNLDELRKILADVETCCTQATEASWIGVDRQGGI